MILGATAWKIDPVAFKNISAVVRYRLCVQRVYFQDNHKKRLNWKKLARAVEFFGGEMKIDLLQQSGGKHVLTAL
jgi:hypothetical protein